MPSAADSRPPGRPRSGSVRTGSAESDAAAGGLLFNPVSGKFEVRRRLGPVPLLAGYCIFNPGASLWSAGVALKLLHAAGCRMTPSMGPAGQSLARGTLQGRTARRRHGTSRERAGWCLTGRGTPWS